MKLELGRVSLIVFSAAVTQMSTINLACIMTMMFSVVYLGGHLIQQLNVIYGFVYVFSPLFQGTKETGLPPPPPRLGDRDQPSSLCLKVYSAISKMV